MPNSKREIWDGLTEEGKAALRRSIEKKWIPIVEGREDEAEGCALCYVVYTASCGGCPIDSFTNSGCEGSPYDVYSTSDMGSQVEFQAAQGELRFLAEFLPEDDGLWPQIRAALARKWKEASDD